VKRQFLRKVPYMESFGAQIAGKRKMMGLSQREAASLIEKMYNVKISHSYLSLIERGRIKSISSNLKTAINNFFRLAESGEQIPFRRIPHYEDDKVDRKSVV
jgi:transcriptional regulator with XRE-family HTH domain